MCSQFPLKSSLGGPKGYIEIAYSYQQRGHNVTLVGIDQIVGEDKPFLNEDWRIKFFPAYLKDYILANHSKYDVIEYEGIYLPFNLKDKVKSLLVARNVLLELNFRYIKLPRFPGFKSFLSSILLAPYRSFKLNKRISQALVAMNHADLVNVSNYSDKNLLIKYGINPNKIIMQAYGIKQERLNEFLKTPKNFNDQIIIAFVGSFDKRKGAVEFPNIIHALVSQNSKIKFKLMGVLGMFPNKDKILEYLGPNLSMHVEIIEKFKPEELPMLLSNCSLGIFPSHCESFGFGALEMMASGIPVVGYNCPGLDLVIPQDLLVERGSFSQLCNKVNELISNKETYHLMNNLCSKKVQEFIYETQENHSLNYYLHSTTAK